ncbi:MAG: hypothetical protein ACRDLB_16990 [Actinomycetota bacterium]
MSEPQHDAVFDDLARCPSCGSLNDSAAEWCGQCMVAFGPRSEEDVPSPDLNVLGTPLVAPESFVVPTAQGGLFGVEGGRPVWRCARCFTRNPMESDLCSECKLAFMESAKREAEVSTALLAEDTARKTVGIVGWGARIMLIVGGLVAPVVLLWTAVAGVVAYLVRKMFGRPR